MAVGAALARKLNGKSGKIFCLVGDGECNEGTIWESLQMAVKLSLDNISTLLSSSGISPTYAAKIYLN